MSTLTHRNLMKEVCYGNMEFVMYLPEALRCTVTVTLKSKKFM